MIEWFASHNGIEQLFLLSGIVGGIILLFRMILMIVGLDHHGDVHIDSDAGFQALTIQGVSSFLAMFGVVGYTLFTARQLGAALAAGRCRRRRCRSMWVIHKIFRGMLRLQSSGTVSLFAAVGQRRFGVPDGRQRRRAGADQFRQPAAGVRSRVGGWFDDSDRHADSRTERDRQYPGSRAGDR